MRKTNLFAAATAALIVACVWDDIDPFQAMLNATRLSSSHYDDFSLVFS
jgi:hypothetical protein